MKKYWKFTAKFEIIFKTFIEISANFILKFIKIILKFQFTINLKYNASKDFGTLHMYTYLHRQSPRKLVNFFLIWTNVFLLEIFYFGNFLYTAPGQPGGQDFIRRDGPPWPHAGYGPALKYSQIHLKPIYGISPRYPLGPRKWKSAQCLNNLYVYL